MWGVDVMGECGGWMWGVNVRGECDGLVIAGLIVEVIFILI